MRPNKKSAEVASWAAHEGSADRRAYLFGLAEALERGGWPDTGPFELDVELADSDPVLSALVGALNLQQAVHCWTSHLRELRPQETHLDGPYHFDRIREAIRTRQAELQGAA